MMGHQSKVQNKLFYTAINLEQRVRKTHILRKVKRYIDFDFIYNEVKDKYGLNGNESVAPPVILKMMLLLIFYNVRSERELAVTITDPDASVTRRGKGKSKLQYQIHRGVDKKCEVITATEVTPGEVNEAHRMQSLVDSHQKNTGQKVETAVADSKYGTIENYLACKDQGIKAHINSLEQSQKDIGSQKGIFPKEAFSYDADNDIFICPAGQILKKRKYFKKRKHYEYIASASICNSCQLKGNCTKAKSGRTLKRHARQDDLDFMVEQANNRESKKDIKTRQYLMERSFARGTRYGYKRARWRRLWRVQIQEYPTASIENIMVLLRNVKEPAPALNMAQAKPGYQRVCMSLQQRFSFVIKAVRRNINHFFAVKYFEAI